MALRLAFFVSGSGSNLQYIIDAVSNKELNAQIVCVVSDRTCYALQRARHVGIPVNQFKKTNSLSEEINTFLRPLNIDIIVLAGFLSILSAKFCTQWNNKIINLHPALLPKYGGMGMWGKHIHKKVLENQEQKSGVSIHYVTGEVDKGKILAQSSCNINKDETIESLRKKIHALEHPLLLGILKNMVHEKG